MESAGTASYSDKKKKTSTAWRMCKRSDSRQLNYNKQNTWLQLPPCAAKGQLAQRWQNNSIFVTWQRHITESNPILSLPVPSASSLFKQWYKNNVISLSFVFTLHG